MKRTILLIAIFAWLMIPTGTPDDIIAFTLMKYFGMKIYLMMIAGLILLMWHYKINFQKIHKALKEVTKKWVK